MAKFSPSESSHSVISVLDDDDLPGEEIAVHNPGASDRWIFALVIVALLAGSFWLGASATRWSTRPPASGPFTAQSTTTPAPMVVVDISGQVNKPGVYTFAPNARVQDAIRKAGGPKKQADLEALNLAAWLQDGQKIEVPTKASADEKVPHPKVPSAEENPETNPYDAMPFDPPALPPEYSPGKPTSSPEKKSKTASAPASKPKKTKPKPFPKVPRAQTASGGESKKADPDYLVKHPVNLNRATAEELQLLPGIGPAMADKILAKRKEKGGFKSVEDLDEVSGIGEKKMEKLRPLVAVE